MMNMRRDSREIQGGPSCSQPGESLGALETPQATKPSKNWTCPKCGYASSLSVSKKTVAMGCGKCGTSVDYKDGEIAALHITELAKPKTVVLEGQSFKNPLMKIVVDNLVSAMKTDLDREMAAEAVPRVLGKVVPESFEEFAKQLTVEDCGASVPFVINEMQRNILEVIEARAVPPKMFLPKCRSRISYASLLLARKKKGL